MAERRGDAHVQMARELGMNPATLGTLDHLLSTGETRPAKNGRPSPAVDAAPQAGEA